MHFVQAHLDGSVSALPEMVHTPLPSQQASSIGPRLEDIAHIAPKTREISPNRSSQDTEHNPKIEDLVYMAKSVPLSVVGNIAHSSNGCSTRFDDIELHTELNLAI